MNEHLLMPKSRLMTFLEKELRELLAPTVFFAVSFNLIVLTTDHKRQMPLRSNIAACFCDYVDHAHLEA
jgi:hypothetical protein